MGQRTLISPEGALQLVVGIGDDGDHIVGFAGCTWHTHASVLAALTGLEATAAIDEFVGTIMSNRVFICILRKGGIVVDIWVSDHPSSETVEDRETLEIRHWCIEPAGPS